MSQHFKIERKYINDCSGKISNNIVDVLSNEVVVDPTFIPKGAPEKTTPFMGISVLNHAQVFEPYIKNINRSGSFNPILYFDALEESIGELWDPNKFHLVFHSSGYDSRITSFFRDRLYKKNPAEILFVSFPNEQDLFKAVMRYKGWSETDIFIYDPHKDPAAFDFTAAWHSLNGMSDYPISRFYHCVNYLKKIGKVPNDNVLVWVSGYNNEILAAKASLDSFLSRWYYTRNARLDAALPFDRKTPFLYPKLLEAVFSSNPAGPPKEIDKYRYELVRMLDPGLAELPRKGHNRNKIVPAPIFTKILNDFENSIFYKYINKKDIKSSPNYIGNRVWWGAWSLASLIEYLVKNNIKVKYGNQVID